MRVLKYAEAISEALREEMERDERVFLMGEDIGLVGGIFKITKGFIEKFGEERVRDTPISEDAIIGAAIGAAIVGMRPVVEIMYADFLYVGGDQLFNHLPKIRFMTGGKLKLPVVIRTQFGLYRYTAAQHSQVPFVQLMNTPGVYIEVPSTPYDAKGLLKAAIRDDNPDVFFENADLYYTVTGPVPEEDYIIPLGKADVKREGRDVTIFAISYMVHVALKAAELLSKEGIEVEVIDPRTLSPLDKKTLIDSVKETGRLIIVEPDVKTAGVGAEISAIISEEAYDYLKSPILRLGDEAIPAVFSKPVRDECLPKEETVIQAVKKLTVVKEVMKKTVKTQTRKKKSSNRKSSSR